MPRSLVVSHLLLLAAVSAIVFPTAVHRLVSGPAVPVGWVTTAAVLAVVLALVMAATEVFSGRRWTAVLALAATVTGLICTLAADPASVLSVVAWAVAWLAIGSWFAGLALRARENR